MADRFEDEEFISLSSSDSDHHKFFEGADYDGNAIDSDTEDRILAQLYYTKDRPTMNSDFSDDSKVSDDSSAKYTLFDNSISPKEKRPKWNENTMPAGIPLQVDSGKNILSDEESRLSKYSIVKNQFDASGKPPDSFPYLNEESKLRELSEDEDINIDDNFSLDESINKIDNDFKTPDDISNPQDYSTSPPVKLWTHRVNIQLDNEQYKDEGSEESINEDNGTGTIDSDMEEVDMDDVDIQDDSRRYFLSATSSGPTCFSCGQKGHIRADCPQENDPEFDKENSMACIFCGKKGHTKHKCPQDICYKCGRLGHQSRRCPIEINDKDSAHIEKKKIEKKGNRILNGSGSTPLNDIVPEYDGDSTNCGLCGLPFHRSSECSLRWRQYVFHDFAKIGSENPTNIPNDSNTLGSTLPNPEQVEQAYKKIRKGCYHCASSKHFGDDCSSRFRKRSFYPTPAGPNSNMEWSAFNEYSYKYVRAALLHLSNLNAISSAIHSPSYEVALPTSVVGNKAKVKKANKQISPVSERNTKLKIATSANSQSKRKYPLVPGRASFPISTARQRYVEKDSYIPSLSAQQQAYLSSSSTECEGYEPLIPNSTGTSPERFSFKLQQQQRSRDYNEVFIFKHGGNNAAGNFVQQRPPQSQRTMLPFPPPGTRGNSSYPEQGAFAQPPPFEIVRGGPSRRQPTLYVDADEPYYARSSPSQEFHPHHPAAHSGRFKQNYINPNQFSHRNTSFYHSLAPPSHPPPNHQGIPGNPYSLQHPPSFPTQHYIPNPPFIPDYGSPPAIHQSSMVGGHPYENYHHFMPSNVSPRSGSASLAYRDGHLG